MALPRTDGRQKMCVAFSSRRGIEGENSACVAARPNTIIASFVHYRISFDRGTPMLNRNANCQSHRQARHAHCGAMAMDIALGQWVVRFDDIVPVDSGKATKQ
jgi:hypothetical protein